MDDNELMTIGRFARLSGVSIHALRHYDEVGLLTPAEVDSVSGYRRYERGQLDRACLIQTMRWADLPLEGVRQVLDAANDDAVREVLVRHRHHLEQQRDSLTARIDDVDRYLQGGITMPTIPPGCRPVRMQLAVDDRPAALDFYTKAFGFHYGVSRRTSKGNYSSFQFGVYGQDDDFFLLQVVDDPTRCEHPAHMTFGLLVDDLDSVHAQAIAAGAVEVCQPHDAEGMPRCSAVKDPSGNWIWLYQRQSEAAGCKPVQIKVAVDELKGSIAFYKQAFGLQYEVTRRTADEEYSSFKFGEPGHDGFFLLHFLDDPSRFDRPSGPSTFSFLVDDLDAVHARALAAGATEVSAPYEAEGMPRSASVRDPSGNLIGLAQG